METLKNIGWAILGWIVDLYISIAFITAMLIGLPLAILLSLMTFPFMVLWGLFTDIRGTDRSKDKEDNYVNIFIKTTTNHRRGAQESRI